MALPSPLQVELSLRRLEQRVIDACTRAFGTAGALVVAAALALALGFGTRAFGWLRVSPPNGGIHVLYFIRFSLPLLVAASLLPLFLESFPWWGLAIINAGVWALSCAILFAKLPATLQVTMIAVYPALVLWGYSVQLVREGRCAKIWPWVLLTAVGAGLLSIDSLLFRFDPKLFVLFWNLKPQFLVFQVILLAFAGVGGVGHRELLVAPTFAARGLVLPESVRRAPAQRVRLWWHGFLNVANGLVAAAAHWGLQRVLAHFPSPFVRYPSRYVLALLAIVAFMNVLTGLLRLYGYAVMDGTNFVWLARSPAEYWRRGSVYSYLIIQKYVFLPLLSRLRAPRLSRFVAFFVFINLKIGVLNYVSLASYWLGHGPLGTGARPVREYYSLIHWVLWFLVLEVSYPLFPRTRLDERPLRAWAATIVSHFVMASLYLCTHFLYLRALALGFL